MPKPHGDILVNNFINSSKIDNDLFVLNVDLKLKKDIENISYGIFSPLKGFVSEADFYSILKRGRLSNDLPWTIPIILDVDNDLAKKIKDEKEVALQYNGNIFGVLQVKGLYNFDKLKSAKLIFQTRNVPHVAHEMLQKAVLNIYDGLFINPLIGKKKTGDFKDEVILKSYQSLINNYYPKSAIIFSTLHTEMKYAGPKEAIHHAIMRKNFGCSHIIIGRDHAGVGNYYHPFAAHDIFKEYPDLGIEPIFFPAFYYCKKCSNFANERICPHDSNFKEELSGTKMRKMFLSGLLPPAHLMRTEISQIISSYKNPFVE